MPATRSSYCCTSDDGTTELKDWMDAEKDQKSGVSKFQDMNERVLANLEFSYDNLLDIEPPSMPFIPINIPGGP